ncbi:InlB B-repeat-containing protein [Curtanaerobium respiraculi]|uniref:InlB B-repeat-containing protein n=1 Tax=Curtanaerobium respiraculi TaxID=2949669 RepID=UPI0024B33E2C|nr:InlB B-repeat-containing protein [Curtanaerobium respiraculi]
MRTWFDARDLNLKNGSLTVAGFGQTFYVNSLNMVDSELTINKGGSWGGTGMTIQSSSSIVNSHITTNAGSTAGISIGAIGGTIRVTNSTLEFNNSGTGGLNVNTGAVVLTDSVLKGNGKNSGALFGVQTNGSIEINGNSRVETPASKNGDTGASTKDGNYVVLGGSHLVKYEPSYNSSSGSTVPTNGEANGNEKLMLFTLADASQNELAPLNKSGNAYAYPVANASEDAQKHVWIPGENVTFKLNADDAAETVSATFADGSKSDKNALAMRGYALPDAIPAEGTSDVPSDPVAPGYKFLGWYYKDGAGTERAFDLSMRIAGPIAVYAKWKSDSASYGVVYHNNLSDDAAYTATGSKADRSSQIASLDTVIAANPAFSVKGKTFTGWNTSADGTGESYEVGSTVIVPADKFSLDLYAQWEDQMVTVRFSANGGIFDNDSVFKKNPDAFEISTDVSGGEIATVKKQAKVSDNMTLNSLLKSLNASLDANAPGISNPVGDDGVDAYKGIASRNFFVLDPDVKEQSIFGYVYDHENAYWFTDAEGKNQASIHGGTKVDADLTYYLKWKNDPAVKTVEARGTLDADMWGDSKEVTNQIKFVKSGEKFSLTGAIVTTDIKNQMSAIEDQFSEKPENFSNIVLSDIRSTFTASITLPEDVKVPADAQVKVDGLGKLFTVDSTKVKGQTVTVVFKLADGIDTYQKLKDAVNSTGLAATHGASDINDSDLITATVSGLSLVDGVESGKELTAIGDVDGTFHSIAQDGETVKRFEFSWGSQQLPAGKDPKGDKIQQTLVTVVPLESELPADLEVDGDTEHAAVHEVFTGDKVKLTGVVDVSNVKEQMSAIEKQFNTTPDKFETIKLSELESSFKATLTLPDGMEYADDLKKEDVKVGGFADTFTVTDLLIEGQKITVTMTLKDGIDNYKQLKDAVDAVDKEMTLTVPKIEIDPGVNPGTKLTVPGTVTGTFFSKATSASGTTKAFSFTWNGVQTAEGRDAIVTDENDPTIQATLMPVSTTEAELEGDMLVDTDTEHDAVIKREKGSSFDLTGAVNVASIKEQMDDIEKLYPNTAHKDIRLDIRGFDFTASFTVPDGIELPEGLDVSQVKSEDFGKGFKVSHVKVEGKTVTVSFELADAGTILTYDQLEAVVDGAGDNGENNPTWMKLTIPGLKLSSDAEAGKQFTIKGEVAGTFKSYAQAPSGKNKAFSFKWNGTQWAPGKDAVAIADEPIQLTIEATEPWISLNETPKVTAKDFTITAGDVFEIMNDMKVSASDEEDGDLTDKVEIVYPDGFDTAKSGVYLIVFKVTDSNGATSITSATLTVLQKAAPAPAPDKPDSVKTNDKPDSTVEPETSRVTEEESKAETPKTGDADFALPLGALMIVSLIVLGLVVRREGRE